MATYTISFLSQDAFSFSSGEPSSWSGGETSSEDPGGGSWTSNSTFTLTYSSSDLTTVTIDDSTNHMLEDDANDQIVTATSDSSVVTTGSNLEDEYEITVEDSDGNTYRMVAISDDSNDIIGYTFEGAWPASGTTLTYVSGTNQDEASMCFSRGVLIATPDGDVLIENLKEGDLVLTKDHGAQPIRWISSTKVSGQKMGQNEKIRPIRLQAGALGAGHPTKDLVVSPQHRILVKSRIAERMFGQDEVLIAAKQLLSVDGVEIAVDLDEVEYFHMLFDRHEIVLANGTETESLYTGPEALKAAGKEARNEILSLFPELKSRDYMPPAARIFVSGKLARKLTLRHVKNTQPLIAA